MTTALAESVALAETTGIDPQLIFKVLKASPALNCGYYTIKEKAFLQKDFTPAFSLDNLAKDVRFMLQEAQSRGLTLPVTDAVYQALARAQAAHQGSKDVAAVYSILNPIARPNPR
jgi:3-hydroxyisobutyrate dehydrogenase-like beta-hydroxyacid dehydrogenase